ncbi:glycosyltransferase family 4 protein [Photorhabdus aegyptia]|uniref:Glycosyltransferase n=1 Tax=Photorhabdus aegyptia TaxID=2805098 RepID=A0A022PFD0_9GAMM|nr:glycosyltransferase family 4 protein [Photorhabdus aegyptia]EYU14239.1 glycosyltransferase [Photorhabdus aegyptia]KGM27572.1 glycosyl transferase [Photorhabdus luminescens]
MRLALIVDDYLPHSTRVAAKMMHELALELACQGHEPFVITPGEDNSSSCLIADIIDGIQVLRFPSGRVKDVPKVVRAFNESLLSIRAWWYLKDMLASKRIDGIIYYSPSIFFGPLVKKIKSLWNCPSYLILRDIFPQWVIDEGMLREKSIIARYFRFFENINYKAADFIGLMSQKNLEFFCQYKRHNHLDILYNWAKPVPAQLPLSYQGIRYQLGLMGKVIFFYGGNIGRAQDMDNLLRLAIALKNRKEAHFLFIGQGDEVELVKNKIEQFSLDNITYLPSVPQEEFKNILCEVDVGLFSLARSHKVHNFPGKILGYMVNKIPILGSVNLGNDLADVINGANAGIVLVNGEDDKLVGAAELLLSNKDYRIGLGNNAWMLLHDKFSVRSATDNICKQLTEMKNS